MFEELYKKFSHFCQEHGVIRSKKIELFMESIIEKEPEARKEYLEKLDRIRKGRFLRVINLAQRYGLSK